MKVLSWHGNVPSAEVVVPILDVAADGVEEALLARPNAIAIVSGHEDITWMHQKRLEMFRKRPAPVRGHFRHLVHPARTGRQ